MKHTFVYSLVIASISILLLIGILISSGDTTPFIDEEVVVFVQPLDQSYLYKFARWFTKLGSKMFLIPFTSIMSIVFLWLYRHWLPPLLFAGGTLLSHLSNQLIKHVIQRERPSIIAEADAIGYSFPSGHAMISIVCYGLFLYFLLQKVSTAFENYPLKVSVVLLILCIGLSRVIINVHYITDVMGGFAFGFLLLICLQKLYEVIQSRLEKPH